MNGGVIQKAEERIMTIKKVEEVIGGKGHTWTIRGKGGGGEGEMKRCVCVCVCVLSRIMGQDDFLHHLISNEEIH